MADIERLSIALPTPMADNVRQTVEAGSTRRQAKSFAMPCGFGKAAVNCASTMLKSCRSNGTRERPAAPQDRSTSIRSLPADAACKSRRVPSVAELAISRRAMEELGEIWDYIALDSPAAADRVLLHSRS